MNYNEFQETLNNQPVHVAYFSHDECNVCKVLKPQVRGIVEEFNQVQFTYVNTKESAEVSGQFMVFAVPTIILFYEGREAKRYSRHISLQDFRSFLERMTEN